MLAWHLYQAALAGRDIFIDQRHEDALAMRGVLEQIVAHPAGVDSADAHRDPALHEAVLDQQRSLQQPHRAQVRPAVHARGVRRRGQGVGQFGRQGRDRRRRVARWPAGPAAADVLRPQRGSHRHQQESRAGQGHPALQRQQPLRRGLDGRPEGVRREVRPQFAPREGRRHAGRRGLQVRRQVRAPD